MNKILFFNETKFTFKNINNINKILDLIVKTLNLDNDFELSVIFNTISKQQNINSKYYKRNYIPDVLSFPVDDAFINLNKNEDGNKVYLGDIFLCIDQIKKQAKDKNILFEDELYLLLIHGILHLLNYNHIENEEKKIMFKLQEKILKEFQQNDK